MLELYLYTEINLFAIFIIVMLFAAMKRNFTMMIDDRIFRALLLFVGAIIFSDSVAKISEALVFDGAYMLTAAINLIYYLLSGIVCLLWVVYTDIKIFTNSAGLKKRTVLYFIPFVILTVTSLASPFTGWIFRIDENNVYIRGPLFVVHAALSFGMLLYAGITALVAALHEPQRSKRPANYILFSFTVMPLLGGIIQLFFYGLPVLWICSTISLLLVFINIQNQQISIDALTGINNRRTLNRYLESRTSDLKKGDLLCMILLDIDHFKKINDNFGHVTGDAALIRTATILKTIAGHNNCFLARYGGDEFAIVALNKGCDFFEKVSSEINEAVSLDSNSGNKKYPFSLSMGCAYLTERGPSEIDKLISDADAAMYAEKARKNISR